MVRYLSGMIPVLDAAQMRRVDAFTMAHAPIASIDLMERAAEACTAWLDKAYPLGTQRGFAVFCGPGNNGGDGLAIARLLHLRGHSVRVFLCTGGRKLSPDARVNLDRLGRTSVALLHVMDGSLLPDLPAGEVVVDALFGVGLDRPLAGTFATVVERMNSAVCIRIAIDMPSGLPAVGHENVGGWTIVRAHRVLTFQCAKLALLLPEYEPFVGGFDVLDIGLAAQGIAKEQPAMYLLERSTIRGLLPDIGRFDHKGRNGHALLMAGGAGRLGAAVLAARAAVRSGAGLITVQLPTEHQAVMHAAVPEAMCVPMDHADVAVSGRFTAVAIGPGIGLDEQAAGRLEGLLRKAAVPLVIDADALTLLARDASLLELVPKGSILTPHPLELERLVGSCASGFERLQRARDLAMRKLLVVVLKGANTAICGPDGTVRFNNTGNPGMAKGGTGDALTGVMAGLLAQGMEPLNAAMAAVHAHGLAGDLAADTLGQQGMNVSDIIGQLPLAWKRIRQGG